MNSRKWNINKAIKPLFMCIITFLIIIKIVIEAKNTSPVFEIKVAGEKIFYYKCGKQHRTSWLAGGRKLCINCQCFG